MPAADDDRVEGARAGGRARRRGRGAVWWRPRCAPAYHGRTIDYKVNRRRERGATGVEARVEPRRRGRPRGLSSSRSSPASITRDPTAAASEAAAPTSTALRRARRRAPLPPAERGSPPQRSASAGSGTTATSSSASAQIRPGRRREPARRRRCAPRSGARPRGAPSAPPALVRLRPPARPRARDMQRAPPRVRTSSRRASEALLCRSPVLASFRATGPPSSAIAERSRPRSRPPSPRAPAGPALLRAPSPRPRPPSRPPPRRLAGSNRPRRGGDRPQPARLAGVEAQRLGTRQRGSEPCDRGHAVIRKLAAGLVVDQVGKGRGDERGGLSLGGAGDDPGADRGPARRGLGRGPEDGHRERAAGRSPDRRQR